LNQQQHSTMTSLFKLCDWIDPSQLDWEYLSSNPKAIGLLEQNQHKIHWINLSENPNAIHLLQQNQDKIDWTSLSRNPHAIQIIEKNVDKINWGSLCTNPNAVHILVNVRVCYGNVIIRSLTHHSSLIYLGLVFHYNLSLFTVYNSTCIKSFIKFLYEVIIYVS